MKPERVLVATLVVAVLGAAAGGAVSLVMHSGGAPDPTQLAEAPSPAGRAVDGDHDTVRGGTPGARCDAPPADPAPASGVGGAAAAGADGAVADTPKMDRSTEPPPTLAMVDADAERSAAQALARAEEARERIARSMQLRRLPEAERWERALDELVLTVAQLDEIKAARVEFDAAVETATTTETRTSAEGVSTTYRTMNGRSIQAARRDMDKRVRDALTAEQAQRWNSEGWREAITGTGVVPSNSGAAIATEDKDD